ncbi:MAG: AMP-binding protein [Desulfovibrio sp.]|jgi:4-coumarate--CoA ligase (photoactive yellow protein activation family)|nr:AMP-binding protein [Desulfovibrio sp.]
MTFSVEYSDACRIVRSLALSLARAGVVSEELLSPQALPAGRLHELAGAVALFFGLDGERAAALEKLDSYAQWADHVYREAQGAALVFSTSGSSGHPSLHSFIMRDLEEEAESLKPFFADRRRIVSVMPVHHIFGFAFALTLPRVLGIQVLDLPPLPTGDFFRALRSGDLLLAFPVFWKSVLDMCSGPSAPAVPPDIRGVSSGAPCPPEVIEGLLGAGPGGGKPLCAGMTEIYGATEFGAVGIRGECRGGYTLLPHWRRLPLPAGPDGEEWGIGRGRGEAQPLPDRIGWSDERHFVPLRRMDKAVQVAGINVFPERVVALLRGHPAVADCAVRLMRPEEGVRLKAFVVPRAGVMADTFLMRELRRLLTVGLEPASRPKSIRFGECLPGTPTGKSADWDIDDGEADAGVCT